MRFLLILAFLLSALPALHAHQSPATDIYLDYEIVDEDTGEPWIQTMIEGSTHHFPPLQAISPSALPDETATLAYQTAFLEYLRTTCPVTVDGKPLPPSIVSFEFTTYEVDDLAEETLTLPLLLSVIRYELPTPEIPDEIRARWDAFPQIPPGVTPEQMADAGHTEFDLMMVSFEDAEGSPDFRDIPRDDPFLIWRPNEVSVSPLLEEIQQNPDIPDLTELQLADLVPPRELYIPLISVVLLLAAIILLPVKKFPWIIRWRTVFALVLAAYFLRNKAVHIYPLSPGRVADALPDDRVLPLFTALQRNIYTAFDAPTESEIYDRLADSIAPGPLLDRVYTEVYQSLLIEEAEGTKATVEDLTQDEVPIIIRPDEGTTIDIDAQWSVLGIVAHEAHVHRRKNQYHATYTLAPVQGLWKITGITQKLAQRIQ